MEKEKIYIVFTSMHGQDVEFVGLYRKKENAVAEYERLRELNKGSKRFGCAWEEIEVKD